MELLVQKDQYAIYEDKKNKRFNIEFKTPQYALINSIIKTHLIPNSYTDENYRVLTFKAQSVKLLTDFNREYEFKHGKKPFLVSDIAKVIRTLVRQLQYLIEKEYCTIIGYNQDDILVINDEKFAFLGSELIANLDSNMINDTISDDRKSDEDYHLNPTLATIYCPYNTNDFFFSPELLKIKVIPSTVHYKIAYFSLGCLLLSLLLGHDEFYQDYLIHKQPKKLIQQMDTHPVNQTKIYWLLSRCLVEEPNNRTIILI